MKTTNTFKCALGTIFLAFACIQGVAAQDDCCGDTKFDPATEECCGGTTIVAKGRCCNGTELEEGFECCRGGGLELAYDPTIQCCFEDDPNLLVIAKFGQSYENCSDRVQVTGYYGYGDQVCSAPEVGPPYREQPFLIPVGSSPCKDTQITFLGACQVHDECFGNCQPTSLTPDQAFTECNNQFHSLLLDQCYAAGSEECEEHCIFYALVYYGAVTTSLGRENYDTGQDESCQCCPD